MLNRFEGEKKSKCGFIQFHSKNKSKVEGFFSLVKKIWPCLRSAKLQLQLQSFLWSQKEFKDKPTKSGRTTVTWIPKNICEWGFKVSATHREEGNIFLFVLIMHLEKPKQSVSLTCLPLSKKNLSRNKTIFMDLNFLAVFQNLLR